MFSPRPSWIALLFASFAAACGGGGNREPTDAVMQELLLPRIAEFFEPQLPADAEPDDIAAARSAYEALIPAYNAARVLEFRKVGCEKLDDIYRCEFYFQADAGKLGIISTQNKVPFGYRDGKWIAGSMRRH